MAFSEERREALLRRMLSGEIPIAALSRESGVSREGHPAGDPPGQWQPNERFSVRGEVARAGTESLVHRPSVSNDNAYPVSNDEDLSE